MVIAAVVDSDYFCNVKSNKQPYYFGCRFFI